MATIVRDKYGNIIDDRDKSGGANASPSPYEGSVLTPEQQAAAQAAIEARRIRYSPHTGMTGGGPAAEARRRQRAAEYAAANARPRLGGYNRTTFERLYTKSILGQPLTREETGYLINRNNVNAYWGPDARNDPNFRDRLRETKKQLVEAAGVDPAVVNVAPSNVAPPPPAEEAAPPPPEEEAPPPAEEAPPPPPVYDGQLGVQTASNGVTVYTHNGEPISAELYKQIKADRASNLPASSPEGVGRDGVLGTSIGAKGQTIYTLNGNQISPTLYHKIQQYQNSQSGNASTTGQAQTQALAASVAAAQPENRTNDLQSYGPLNKADGQAAIDAQYYGTNNVPPAGSSPPPAPPGYTYVYRNGAWALTPKTTQSSSLPAITSGANTARPSAFATTYNPAGGSSQVQASQGQQGATTQTSVTGYQQTQNKNSQLNSQRTGYSGNTRWNPFSG